MAKREVMVIQEKDLGKFQTLIEAIQSWVKENNDSVKVVKSVYATGACEDKKYYPRAIKVFYELLEEAPEEPEEPEEPEDPPIEP